MTVIKRRTPLVRGRFCTMGIDQSYSSFGVCFLRTDESYSTHVGVFEAKDYGKGVERLESIQQWLVNLVDEEQSTVVYMCREGYAPNSKFGREMAGELVAAIDLALWHSFGAKSTVVAPSALKKYAIGTASKSRQKEDMKLQVFKRWGVEFKTNDEVDAYVLAQVAMGVVGEGAELPKFQQEVLAALLKSPEA